MNAQRPFLCFALLKFANGVMAQTKISGSAHCSEPYDSHTISIEQSADHSFVISQEKCTWVKPMEIAGIQNKDSISTDMYEVTGSTAHGRAFFVDTMANGDTVYYRAEWVVNGLDQGNAQSGKWTWKFAGGTGKFKKITGSGSCDYRTASSTWECQGEYAIAR